MGIRRAGSALRLRCEDRLDMEPFEVSYKTTGRAGKRSRSVTFVLCPTVIAQRLGIAEPIFVEAGDVEVDWMAPVSPAYRALFDRA